MESQIQILKGLHPGKFLERELKKQKRFKGEFALSIREYPQTLSAIISGKRSMNTPLAIRIEKELSLEEGFLMILQVYYDIAQEKRKQEDKNHPDLSLFRPAIFWDTKLEQLDWQNQKSAIINRVFQRGNLSEKKEIIRYYGRDTVKHFYQKSLHLHG